MQSVIDLIWDLPNANYGSMSGGAVKSMDLYHLKKIWFVVTEKMKEIPHHHSKRSFER